MTKADEVEVVDVKGQHAHRTTYYPIKVGDDNINVSSPVTPEGIMAAAKLDPDKYFLRQKLPDGSFEDPPSGKKIDLTGLGIEHFKPVLKEDRTLRAKVVTTSGNYPRKGYEEVKRKERVEKFLKEAARALHLTDVTGWVATVAGNEINPDKTLEENGLEDKVEIHWGPAVGGGG